MLFWLDRTYSFRLAILFSYLRIYFIVHFEAYKMQYFSFFLQNRTHQSHFIIYVRDKSGAESSAMCCIYPCILKPVVWMKTEVLKAIDALSGRIILVDFLAAYWCIGSSCVRNFSAFKSWMVCLMAVTSGLSVQYSLVFFLFSFHT